MDLYRIIDTLIAERNRIDRMIQSLDGNPSTGRVGRVPQSTGRQGKKKPGRKSMDVNARRDVSERMKRYWAKRRGGPGGSANVSGAADAKTGLPGG